MEFSTAGTTAEQCKVIKPTINILLVAMGSFLVALVPAWIIGQILSVLILLFDDGSSSDGFGILMVLGYIIGFIISFIVTILLRVSSLSKTEYRFYSDRIEYFEGFLVKNRKTIPLNRLVNVGQRKGIVEGLFGLGTVYLETAGSSAAGHELALSYLENPDAEYDWLSKYISSNKRMN